jgi:hypothetical protein
MAAHDEKDSRDEPKELWIHGSAINYGNGYATVEA